MRARALADLLGFLAEHAAPLILDEIQYTPELLQYLEDQIDRDRRPGPCPLSGSPFHWRATGGLEVDLIVDRHGHLYAMEVKATATPAPPHAEALARRLALAGPRPRGVLACRIEAPTPLRPGIRAVPWHLAW